MIVDLYSGPGGWDQGARMLGLTDVVGIELDAAACRTRTAAGHKTIQADVSRFPAEQFAGKVTGLLVSSPCITFSAAGKRAGASTTAILGEAIQDALAGRRTRAHHRRRMAAALRAAWWPSPKLTRAERSAKIWAAVQSASQVIEAARFIHACHPEWIALEQVPPVLSLWHVYAAELRKRGYSVWCGKVNAADYGVPQTRERAILIASRVRTVHKPMPTHYDPRKGAQLWGTPWVSMAEALGWGMTERPYFTLATAGGNRGGADEQVGGTGARRSLYAERDSGRWALRRQISPAGLATHRDRLANEPAPTITGGGSAAGSGNGAGLVWVHTNSGYGDGHDYERETGRPSPAVTHRVNRWSFRNNNNNACARSLDEPAGTLFFGGRSNWAAWVRERPATTIQGDPRVGRPGHKDRDKGEAQFAHDSVRITVEEAAILQSFPPGYPWQGSRTKQYEQVGNAWCPRAAAAVIGEAAGIAWQPLAAAYYGEVEAVA